MFKRIVLGFLLVVVCGVGTASAVSFEVTPFVGIRTTGEFDDIAATVPIREVEIDSGTSYGLTFGVEFNENWQAELLFSTQTSDFTATPNTGPRVDLGEIDTTVIHVGGVYQFKTEDDPWRPIVTFSLGSTNFDPEDFGDDSKFSLSLGGGAKYRFNDRLGLKLLGRWITTEINDDDEIYCGAFGCYVVEDSNFLNQFEFTAGLAIRFGG